MLDYIKENLPHHPFGPTKRHDRGKYDSSCHFTKGNAMDKTFFETNFTPTRLGYYLFSCNFTIDTTLLFTIYNL